jgi:hypothetical protein
LLCRASSGCTIFLTCAAVVIGAASPR